MLEVSEYGDLLERSASLLGLLTGQERADAARALELCTEVSARPRDERGPSPAPSEQALRRELARLVEYLSRRSSSAIAFASLGRAALADLAGDARGFQDARRDCDERLLLVGL
jgi:hypothetical protein